MEKRIVTSGEECSLEIIDQKSFLEAKCKTATKSMKSFLREKNLEINSGKAHLI